jgi:hypothetical protein
MRRITGSVHRSMLLECVPSAAVHLLIRMLYQTEMPFFQTVHRTGAQTLTKQSATRRNCYKHKHYKGITLPLEDNRLLYYQKTSKLSTEFTPSFRQNSDQQKFCQQT